MSLLTKIKVPTIIQLLAIGNPTKNPHAVLEGVSTKWQEIGAWSYSTLRTRAVWESSSTTEWGHQDLAVKSNSARVLKHFHPWLPQSLQKHTDQVEQGFLQRETHHAIFVLHCQSTVLRERVASAILRQFSSTGVVSRDRFTTGCTSLLVVFGLHLLVVHPCPHTWGVWFGLHPYERFSDIQKNS